MKIQHVDFLGRNNPFQARRENPRTRHHLTKGSFVQRYPCQAVCTACHQFFSILDITCEQKSILEMTGCVQRMRPQAAGFLQDWARELICLQLGPAKVFSSTKHPSSVLSHKFGSIKHIIKYLKKYIIVSCQIFQNLNLEYFPPESRRGANSCPKYPCVVPVVAPLDFIATAGKIHRGCK